MSNNEYSYNNLINNFPIISDQMTKNRLEIILKNLSITLDNKVNGDIVEFGCYNGTTSLFIRRLLNVIDINNRQFHVYDSFEGLPPKTIKDASVAGTEFKAGELKTSKRQLIKNFKKAGLKTPTIHRSWFDELKEKDIPNSIAFAFLDGDFYYSILSSLNLVWPKLSTNGRLVIDDFDKSNLPGVTRAINDFFIGTDQRVIRQDDLAVIVKS